MNHTHLAQQVPALMSAHPLLAWQVQGVAATPELVVDLWLRREPKRRGHVVFDPKQGLFMSNVLGHVDIHPDEANSAGVDGRVRACHGPQR